MTVRKVGITASKGLGRRLGGSVKQCVSASLWYAKKTVGLSRFPPSEIL